MATPIPPRLDKPEPKERRFYVVADSSVHLDLQKEAHARGTDLWTLGGSVLAQWLAAGCPSQITAASPSPSSSPVADEKGGAE